MITASLLTIFLARLFWRYEIFKLRWRIGVWSLKMFFKIIGFCLALSLIFILFIAFIGLF